MNITEAIKSGKRFKRKDWDDYMFVDSDYFLNNLDSIKREFLLADDWEVEEVRVTITYAEFDAAWMEAVRKNKTFEGLVQQIEFRRLVAKELGL